MQTDLLSALPRSVEVVEVAGDVVPPFDELVERQDGRPPLSIAPALEAGRGSYVSSVCGPMASMKSLRSRVHSWSKPGVTAVVAIRVAYGLNAAQEWRESAPGADEQATAAREALADFEELSLHDRCAAESFGPQSTARSKVWCYLTHSKAQLEDLFRSGHGVCIVSPKACPAFLRALRDMGPRAQLESLYIEEVKGLSQMLFGKILPDCNAMEALHLLATERSRCVFGFCVRRTATRHPTDVALPGSACAVAEGDHVVTGRRPTSCSTLLQLTSCHTSFRTALMSSFTSSRRDSTCTAMSRSSTDAA